MQDNVKREAAVMNGCFLVMIEGIELQQLRFEQLVRIGVATASVTKVMPELPQKDAAETAPGEDAVFVAFAGLGRLWDNEIPLRNRIRTLGRLLLDRPAPGEAEAASPGCVAKTVDNLKFNSSAIIPMVQLMKGRFRVLPGIEALQDELQATYVTCGLNPALKVLSDQAWSLRYLFGVLKAYLYKKTAPKAMGDSLPCRVCWQDIFFVFFDSLPGQDAALAIGRMGRRPRELGKGPVGVESLRVVNLLADPALQMEAKSSPIGRQKDKDCCLTI